MLEQVWKNVFGETFPYIVKEGKIIFTIPRGHDIKVYRLSQLISDMEAALDNSVVIQAYINPEGLLEFMIAQAPKEDTEEESGEEVIITDTGISADEWTGEYVMNPVEEAEKTVETVPAKKGRGKRK